MVKATVVTAPRSRRVAGPQTSVPHCLIAEPATACGAEFHPGSRFTSERLVVLGGVEGELAEEFAGFLVDDAEVLVGDLQSHRSRAPGAPLELAAGRVDGPDRDTVMPLGFVARFIERFPELGAPAVKDASLD